MQEIQKVTARAIPVVDKLTKFKTALVKQNAVVLDNIQKTMKDFQENSRERQNLELYWRDRTELVKSVDDCLTDCLEVLKNFIELYKVSFRDLGSVISRKDQLKTNLTSGGPITLDSLKKFADNSEKTDPSDPEKFAQREYQKTLQFLRIETYDTLKSLDSNKFMDGSLSTYEISVVDGRHEFANPKYKRVVYRLINNKNNPEIQVFYKLGREEVLLVDRHYYDRYMDRFFVQDATLQPVWDVTKKYITSMKVRKRVNFSEVADVNNVHVLGAKKGESSLLGI